MVENKKLQQKQDLPNNEAKRKKIKILFISLQELFFPPFCLKRRKANVLLVAKKKNWEKKRKEKTVTVCEVVSACCCVDLSFESCNE